MKKRSKKEIAFKILESYLNLIQLEMPMVQFLNIVKNKPILKSRFIMLVKQIKKKEGLSTKEAKIQAKKILGGGSDL